VLKERFPTNSLVLILWLAVQDQPPSGLFPTAGFQIITEPRSPEDSP
jgi:hypothetical protein